MPLLIQGRARLRAATKFPRRGTTLLAGVLAILFACGDGTCSGCGDCQLRPISTGFPRAERVSNAVQVRLTSSGVQFIEQNFAQVVASLLPGALEFDIPHVEGKESGFGYEICGRRDCVARAEIQNFNLVPVAPSRLSANLQLVVDSRDRAGNRRSVPARIDPPIFKKFTCDVDLNTRRGGRSYIGVVADFDLLPETRAPRQGYTRLAIARVSLAPGEGIQNDDIKIDDCSVSFLLNLFKGTLVDELEDELNDALSTALDDELCTTRGEYGCPAGTVEDGPKADDICRFSAGGACVPVLLGVEGEGEFGQAVLSDLAPSLESTTQLTLAAGGAGEAINGGFSVFFDGGFRPAPVDESSRPAIHPCVPSVEPPARPTIPRLDAFRGNTIIGTGGTATSHAAVGISEEFLNHAGYGVFASGQLCLEVGTEVSQEIASGLFSLLIESLGDLVFPETNVPMSLAFRPQRAPVFEVGSSAKNETLVTATLPELAIDFYVWSSERYVRFMTYVGDVNLEIDLRLDDGALVVDVPSITTENDRVENSELLREEPEALAGVVSTVLVSFAGPLLANLGAIALPDLVGLELDIKTVVGIETSGHELVSIYADLRTPATAQALVRAVDTSARLLSFDVERAAFRLESFRDAPWPVARVRVDLPPNAGGSAGYEHSWRINGMMWSPWTPADVLEVTHPALRFQGRHRLEVRSRRVGEPATTDLEPTQIPLVVDGLAPRVELERDDQGARISAVDVISERLEVRVRVDEGPYSDWKLLEDEEWVPLPHDDTRVAVEVRDESGNIGRAQSALLAPGSGQPQGCGCSVPGRSTSRGSSGLPLWSALLGLLLVALLRRRTARKHAMWVAVASLVGLSGWGLGGCSGSGDSEKGRGPGDDGVVTCEDGDCEDPDNPDPDGLAPGLLATHLGLVMRNADEALVSGYNAGNPPMQLYGDLVVGQHDPASQSTRWETVDGLPADASDGDAERWRGGSLQPGDDVGRWTSLAQADDDTFLISYHDRTNRALKVAAGAPGSWGTHVVDQTNDAGRYSSLVIQSDGHPAVAYMRVVPSGDDPTLLIASASVAFAEQRVPSEQAQWTVTTVGARRIPCRPSYCGEGQTCLAAGGCVQATNDCDADCGDGEVCHEASCQAVFADGYVEDVPPGYGLYNALQVTEEGLALVFYDSIGGNLWGARWNGEQWSEPFLIDGAPNNGHSGDVGVGASLFVDPDGRWHVAYADRLEGSLHYAIVEGDMIQTVRVDDGSTDGENVHLDGVHRVGDDSSVVVTAGGEVRIVYQDTTALRAMVARGPLGNGSPLAPPSFEIGVLDDRNQTGFWLEQVLVDDTSWAVTWWRNESEGRRGIRLLSMP